MESVDGDPLRGRGFMLRDADYRTVSFDDQRLAEAGALVTRVAGISHRAEAAQRSCFDPGWPVTLVRDAQNAYDENAVAIYDATGRDQVGFLPREVAAAVAPRLDAGEELSALCLWEWRTSDGWRCALRVIVGPPEVIAALEP